MINGVSCWKKGPKKTGEKFFLNKPPSFSKSAKWWQSMQKCSLCRVWNSVWLSQDCLIKQGSASKYFGGFLLQSFWGTSAPTQSHLFYTQPFQIILELESYLCDLLNWKSICCQWSNKLLLIFSIGGYSHGAFWYVFFIKSLFRKKKDQNASAAKKYSCRVLREKNQRGLRVTPEKRNCKAQNSSTANDCTEM